MKKLKIFLLPALIIFFWWIGSQLNIFNDYIMPSPQKVLESAYILIKKGSLQQHLMVSLYRVLSGFVITFVIAFPLAIIVGLNQTVLKYLMPLLQFIRHIPPIALIPLLILWFGIGEMSKLSVIILATFFPIFLNTLNGIVNCDKNLIEVGKVYGFSKKNIFFKIILPQAMSSVIVGMQLGLGYSWRSLMGAELIAASSGIGYMIIEAEQLSRPDIVLVGILTIGFIGCIADYTFIKITENLKFFNTEDFYGGSHY